MPSRILVARELAEIFKVIGHADRIRLIEELRKGEQDVNTLAEMLDLSGPRVSQHLSVLRIHRIVGERREGRHHLYQLAQPEFADLIADGLTFLEGRLRSIASEDISKARQLWGTDAPGTTSGRNSNIQSR